MMNDPPDLPVGRSCSFCFSTDPVARSPNAPSLLFPLSFRPLAFVDGTMM